MVEHADTSPAVGYYLKRCAPESCDSSTGPAPGANVLAHFSFRKQARTKVFLSDWSASMGRADSPAWRAKTETSLTPHVSPCAAFLITQQREHQPGSRGSVTHRLWEGNGGRQKRRPVRVGSNVICVPAGVGHLGREGEELRSSTPRLSVSWLGGTK